MSATEFVALSEERIEEVANNAAWSVPQPQFVLQALPATRDAVRIAASEASENTKRWLMEAVCWRCGESSCVPVLRDIPHVTYGYGPEQYAGCSPELRDWRITRAEYLSRTEPR